MTERIARHGILPDQSLESAEGLSKFLNEHSIKTQDYILLQGGYTSTVYRAKSEGQNLIIKHARGRDSFYPVKRKLEETRAVTEVEVLKRLNNLFPNQVPQIYDFFPNENIIIMSDVGSSAKLGINYLLEGRADERHATELGFFLGKLKQATADWEPFETVEQPFEQVWTRGLEVDVASEEWGKQMRKYYLGSKPGFVWPDGHPKNVFFAEKDPSIRAIDFDCSHFADQDYILPNFLGQIPVFAAMGHITIEQGLEFMEQMIKAYTKVEPISPFVEKKMVFYAGAQTVQRQDGKWLFDVCGGNDEKSLRRKAFLFYFGRKVIYSTESFDQYLDLFKQSTTEWGAILDIPIR
jgi:hypothetical protein